MKPTLRAKLDSLVARRADLERLLASEDATRDMDKFRNYSREHADVDQHRQDNSNPNTFAGPEHREEQRAADKRKADSADRLGQRADGDDDRGPRQRHCVVIAG